MTGYSCHAEGLSMHTYGPLQFLGLLDALHHSMFALPSGIDIAAMRWVPVQGLTVCGWACGRLASFRPCVEIK